MLVYESGIHAQNPSFAHYTTDEGLPGMEIYNIIQDRSGHIWVATAKGIARFDGNRFEIFTVENGLPGNEILKIYEDASGKVWFGSLTGGLAYYDGKIENSKTHPFLSKPELGKIIRAFKPLFSGEILFCSQNGPTYLLNDTAISLFDTSSHYSIFEKHDHSLLMVDNTNECISEWKNGKQVSKIPIDYNADFDLCEYNIYSELLLIAKRDGLYYYQHGKLQSVDNSKNLDLEHAKFITSDREGYFWIAANSGCYRFKINSDHTLTDLKEYFQGYVVNDVFEDSDHNFWIATRGEGLLMCPNLNLTLFTKSSGLADNNISASYKSNDGTIYCGTLNGFVHVIDKENKIIKSVNLNSLRVQKIINDKNGNIWVACERNIFKNVDSKFININISRPSYKTITMAKDGGILTGGFSRIDKIENGLTTTIFLSDTIIRFYAICEGNNGDLLLGTEKGLYTLENGTFKSFHHEREPFTGWIDAIVRAKNGNFLVTTRDSGMAIINENQISFINKSNGLQSNSCTSIYNDTISGKVYLGTNKGLTILNPLTNGEYKISNFNSSNGLNCGLIYSLNESSGDIILCTEKGLLTFNENDLQETYEVPKLILQNIEINNKVISKSDSTFTHDRNNIKISYSGIAFRDPKSLIYRFKLTPVDTAWIYTNSNTIVFPELSSGKYKFLVQVSAGNNTWNDANTDFAFEILKPFWFEWWFIILILAIIILSFYSVYRYRLNLSKKKNEILTELLQTELKALRAQINPHFIFNSLNSIQDFIFNNEKEAANEYLTKFASLMRMILDNSSRKLVSLSEEINFLKIYLDLESLRFANKFKYEIQVSSNINTDSFTLPPMILQLYIENAILHGLGQKKGDGKLSLSFALENHMLNCVIEDNGIGRKKSKEQSSHSLISKHKSYGMQNNNERIEAINKTGAGKIQYRIDDLEDISGNALGTRIILNFPQDE